MAASPLEPDHLPTAVKDGVVASVVGGLSMAARLLLSTEPVSLGWVVRRICAASIVAAIVGYAIQDHITSAGLKMGCVGASGYAAPECLDYLLRWIKAKGEKEVAKVEGKKKPHGRRKKAK